MLPRTFVRSAAFFGASLALSLVATGALAQQAPLPTLPPAQPEPSGAPAPMAPASASSEETLTVEGGYTCIVGEHAGIERDDARTTADVICHALSQHGARPGVYDIRIGKLGGKLLLVLFERATRADRRVLIQGVEEVPVAGERLVTALVDNKTLEQTENVENVVSSETTIPKQKKVVPGVILGLTGQSAVGTANTASAGVEIDMQFRLHNLALLGEGRAGGIGSADNKLGYASLGVGGRYFLSDGDVAPFLGAGLMFAYFQANQGQGVSAFDGSGFGAYGELGLAFMRSSHVGGVVNFRADIPMFSLDQSAGYTYDASGNGYSTSSSSVYVVPLSLNVGLSFQ